MFFRGEYEIAEGTTAAVFNAVLDYYHTGVIHCPPHVPVLDLRDACDYFLLPFNAATVKCQVMIKLSGAIPSSKIMKMLLYLPQNLKDF